MIKFEIDGKELEAEQGATIIEAADNANISIPRFCYHKKLSIAANCRMCLVEVEKAPKPMPACATPVAEGMVIKTKSPAALMAQRAVMEFLLINHPLDCPICDQGGECELQDLSIGYGKDISRFNQGKRSVIDKDIGPLIATGMTRCIHCTRCVRFGEEIAGFKELGMLNRGEHSEIRSFINNSVNSELSGNMIDVCPVGALTSKPYRFSSRAWELQQRASIAPHDNIGSNIYVHSKNNIIKRVLPKENEAVNESWLSDRDRFSYEGIRHEDRLLKPLVRNINTGKLEESDWEHALSVTVEYVLEQVKSNPEYLLALVSPSCTLEEGYLIYKLFNKLCDTYNIDFNLNNLFNKKYGSHNINLLELEDADNILLIGSCPRKSMPMLNHRIRKAFLNGAKINIINTADYNWNYELNIENIVKPENLLSEVAGLLNSVCKLNKLKLSNNISSNLNKNNVSEYIDHIAEDLFHSRKPVIILGDLVLNHPDVDKIYNLCTQMINIIDCGVIITGSGANITGLQLLEKVFHKDFNNTATKAKVSAENIVENLENKTCLLFNLEPELDCFNGAKILNKLSKSNKNICFSAYKNNNLENYADVVLPVSLFTETSGTYVNIDHSWQFFEACIASDKIIKDSQVRPLWQVLTAVGQLLAHDSDDFKYNSSLDISTEFKNFIFSKEDTEDTEEKIATNINLDLNLDSIDNLDSKLYLSLENNNLDLDNNIVANLIAENNCYHIDSIVRRAKSLHETQDAKEVNFLYLNNKTAGLLNIDKNNIKIMVTNIDNNKSIELTAIVNNKLPEDTVYLSRGGQNALVFEQVYNKVLLKRVL